MEGSAALLKELLSTLKHDQFEHAAFFIINDSEKLHLGAICGPLAQSNNLLAGQLLQSLAPIVGGKGGGKSDMARGAAPDITKFFALKKPHLISLARSTCFN